MRERGGLILVYVFYFCVFYVFIVMVRQMLIVLLGIMVS
jgi:hypothetical protein